MIDYLVLLKKYMEGVLDAEGVTFIGQGPDLTEEEEQALEEIANEIVSGSSHDINSDQ